MDCLAVFNTETVNIWVSEVKLENTLVFKTSFAKHLTNVFMRLSQVVISVNLNVKFRIHSF